MRKREPAEMVVFLALKEARMIVRAKHARAADEELNEILPKLEAEILKRLSAGKPYRPVRELLA